MWELISSMDLERYLDEKREIFLADLREPRDYRAGHIRGAVNFPGNSWQVRISEFPRDRLIVLYCYHGPNSLLAARKLSAMGFWTADLYGGIYGYQGKYLTAPEAEDFR